MKRQSGALLTVVVFVMLSGILSSLTAYFMISQARSRAIDVYHDKNRAFSLVEVALNEAIHQQNMRTDGIDNDADDTIDEDDEGNPSFGTTGWDAAEDDIGKDGQASTNDEGEGDGYPTFGEPDVVPVISPGGIEGVGAYYAYTVDMSADGKDNDGDGDIDEETGFAFNGFARQGGVTAPIIHVQIQTSSETFNIWDNAVTAGDAGAGAAVTGNGKIYGSTLVFGDGLSASDTAIDFSGTSGQRNNYDGGDATLLSYLPSLAAGEDLNAVLRVKHGTVDLSGTGTVGTSAEGVDGIYVNDGYGGNQGTANVFSDNGTTHNYDLPDSIDMPSIFDAYTDPATGVDYATYKDYYTTNSVTINAATVPGWTGTINKQTSSFSVSDASGNSFSWNKTAATITISGRVTVDGNLTLGGTTGPTKVDFTYTGTGALLAQSSGGDSGTVTIHGDLLPSPGTIFPTGAFLGIIAEDDIDLPASAQKKLTGAFFAEGEITSAKQNQVGGAIAANSIDLGTNVPSVYFAQGLAQAMPTWFIGADGAVVEGAEMYRIIKGE